ncbi:molybdopterin-binding oxidoreductase [Roseicella sp. DB1501]|uniref:molybdopterin-binding oxidoreductase n=1 Tax=Roseicella sp. DB1501 TaxID=2730925 RepID=UPI001490B2B3|nr:molybdopterin-binding oxidoreductase [Roseicella sp. DB1501]NOG71386.1 molybdopterin-binding oxidoreductase [Roseicella sp. DB1501]
MPAAFLDALGLLRLGGEIADPGLASVAELRGLAAETQTVAYLSGGQPVTDTYAGVLLRDLLAHAGGVVTDAGVKNDILNHYVVATGSDGYHAVFSLGELEQKFGDEPVMVAYADQSGQLGPGGEDGWLRMVVPGDAAGGRYVSHLVNLSLGSGPDFVAGAGAGGVSSSFDLGGAVAHPASFDAADLAALASVTLTASYSSGAGAVSDTYTGVPLWTLLQEAGVTTDPAVKNDLLDFYVVATGSDGYHALFSMGELDPRFGDGQVLVAYDDTAGQLGPGGKEGFARLVVPEDGAGGRYVSNLVGIEVVRADNHGTDDLVWG